MPSTQVNRPVAVATPLGEDVLLFHSMTASEQLGRLFQFDLDLLSTDHAINLKDILGQNVTVRYQPTDGDARYFNGFVSRFSQAGTHGELFVYNATLRPWFWFLTRTADCRIFQKKKVPDIIKEVFRDHGFSDFEDTLSGSYREWENCVQYRETDFNFLSRLMEQEGIYYYFKHENGKHMLVLSDSISAHEAVKGYEEIPYYPFEQSERREREYIHEWSLNQAVQPGICALNEFDFKNPKANLHVKSSIQRESEKSDYEIYDYPGEYVDSGEGDEYARTRIEELQAEYEQVRGQGNVSGLAAGCLFTLTNYLREDQNREYLLTAAHFSLGPQEYESVGSGSEGPRFSCSFTAMDKRQPFRALRTTPKPVVQGPQTAVVVGKAGEEILTDEYGRVKVQFHWDRYGKADENSSCWVRVAQVWAGKSWGGVHIPRVGQEVIINFLEGDPDHPIITGRVYNEDNKPPYDLPDNATMSGIKSNASKGGGGFNEFRFEDKKGEEQIFIHAEKNMDIRVKNDRFENIDHDRDLVVENNKLEHIKNERHETVDNHHLEKIGGDRNLTVTGKEAKQVDGSLSLKVADDVIEEFGANHSEQVSSDYYVKASNIVIEGTTNVTLKVGQSYISIESSGVKIGTTGQIELEATNSVSVKGTGGVKVESPAAVDVKGTNTTVKGDAMVTVQGGLVKIN